MPQLILVSNRLPVRIDADGTATRTTGGLASALEGAGLTESSTWVGWPGIASEDIADHDALRNTMRDVGTVPVLLTQTQLDGFYEGYSNSTLWPLLHYMIERAKFDHTWADAYRETNQAFADAVLSVARDGDTVWVHDYHLFLLPALLRASGLSLRIGFFLHTPFPSSEIFRVLPERDAIVGGILGSDLIGFHTSNYLRHFRSTVLRTLGIESDVDTLHHGSRELRLGVYPIGHNRSGFETAMATSEFSDALARYEPRLINRALVLSVERLDYTKGVPQKLDAIREFLERHPGRRDKVTFIIIAVPSRQGVEEYDQLTDDVQREVGAINGAFGSVGHAPVQFLHRSFPPEELAALYARADVCLVTPLIDGMNLVAKEFIACKRDHPGTRPGALVLSEFAGAAEEMSHALYVNPHDVGGVADAITEAIDMPAREKSRRTDAMAKRIDRNHAGRWAHGFLDDLAATSGPASTTKTADSIADLAVGLTTSLSKQEKIALFLDYDGSLRDFTARPEDAVPDAGLPPLLSKLASHPLVQVAVISGRPSEFLQEHFGGTPITLVAEHGFRWNLPGSEEWELVAPHVENEWIEHVAPLLERAADLTPGSTVEIKRSSIVWHYRRADPEFGLWRAHGLLSELTSITANLPVSVHHGKKIVEVASQLVNKGVAAGRLIEKWSPNAALAAGDDQTDETMFALDPDIDVFHTVKIGSGSTRAARRTDIPGLRQFLEQFSASLPS